MTRAPLVTSENGFQGTSFSRSALRITPESGGSGAGAAWAAGGA